MKLAPSFPAIALAFLLISLASPPAPSGVEAIGSGGTAAAVSGTGTVCGIVAGQRTQGIQCFHNNRTVRIRPVNASFEAVAGGSNFLCGLQSGGFGLLCWNALSGFQPRRLYYSKTARLTDLTVGDDQVCAVVVSTGIAACWRGGNPLFPAPEPTWKFRTLTSGTGFTCGIVRKDSRVLCWGREPMSTYIQTQFGNSSMSTLIAGDSHACGISTNGTLICHGNNNHGQLDVPFSSGFEFSGLALGSNFSSAIRRWNGLVVCWGGETSRFEYDYTLLEGLSFESIFASPDFVCGLITGNLTVICWGPGWARRPGQRNILPLGVVIPGPCVNNRCTKCGPYPNSNSLCGGGSGNICRSCQVELPVAVPLPPNLVPSPRSNGSGPLPPTRPLSRISLAFLIVRSVGVFMGICAMLYFCIRCGICSLCSRKGLDHTVQNPNPEAHLSSTVHTGSNIGISRLISEKSYRSGSSSMKLAERAEKFSLAELAMATNGFSLENRIGSGSFGVVYRGRLPDGREVAVKRGESASTLKKANKFQEKEVAFGSEVALLTRLHHKHLVGLVGICQEDDERLLVYEYMANGALHDHLHGKNNVEKKCSILNSWKMRVWVALDAARGIEYLHSYAVPPIIHRDIKSSNILLDGNWMARVSDFGLSLMGPESGREYGSSRAVGTVGYIDPEYYVTNVLTNKSDVYGVGVVLLELLTGKRAVFKGGQGMAPIGVVEYAVPAILAGEVGNVMDRRVGPPPLPGTEEGRAVEVLASVAVRCVSLEGKERPSMAEVVADLERALALCEDDSHGSLSNSTYSISSG